MTTRILRTPQDTTRLFQELAALDLEKPVEVSWRVYKEDKTAEQFAFFHVLCGILGQATGYNLDEIKELVKRDILGTVLVKVGQRETEVTRPSSKAKRDECSDLIEGVYRLGAEAGINLPPPRTQWDEKIQRRYK